MFSEMNKSILNYFVRHVRSTAYLASACVHWNFVGDQLNPLIRPLMDALKKESDPLIQVLFEPCIFFGLVICSRCHRMMSLKLLQH